MAVYQLPRASPKHLQDWVLLPDRTMRSFTRLPSSTVCSACRLSSRRLISTSRSAHEVTSRPRPALSSQERLHGRTVRLYATATRFSPSASGGKRTPSQDAGISVSDVDRIKKEFLAQTGIPSETATLSAISAISGRDANAWTDSASPSPPPPAGTEARSSTTAADLLSLDTQRDVKPSRGRTSPKPAASYNRDVADHVSEAAYEIIAHPAVFITPKLLKAYVDLQTNLGRPRTIPDVFRLYASKPMPRLVSGALQLVPQRSGKASNAVDSAIVEAALDAAIEARDLDAALGIVDNGYSTNAFRRAKFIKKALVPVSLITTAPLGAYVLASNLSLLQDTMDSATATNVAFAGILAYVGFTATLGVVVVTTANDQMKRVTWPPGTPLRERWIREDERAALDKVTCSFGFSQETRYGEEEGADFQALREHIMRRGMILDQIELMEGMG